MLVFRGIPNDEAVYSVIGIMELNNVFLFILYTLTNLVFQF